MMYIELSVENSDEESIMGFLDFLAVIAGILGISFALVATVTYLMMRLEQTRTAALMSLAFTAIAILCVLA
jgi:hypothetical protein